jgi:hypothetical protein
MHQDKNRHTDQGSTAQNPEITPLLTGKFYSIEANKCTWVRKLCSKYRKVGLKEIEDLFSKCKALSLNSRTTKIHK